MNGQQEIEVIEYLISKKLPLDLMPEVFDHFCIQVSSLQTDANFRFEDAFENVKSSWKSEFKVLKNYNGSGKDMTMYSKQILERRINLLFLKSFSAAIFVMILFWFSAEAFNLELFKYIVLTIVPLLLSIGPIYFLFNKKDFDLAHKFKRPILNIHQKGIYMIFSSLFMLNIFYMNFSQSISKFYLFFSDYNGYGCNIAIILFISLNFMWFGVFSQFEFIKQLRNTKPFINKYFRY